MSDTKTYKIDAVVAVDPRWVKHMIPSIEDEYEFEEDEKLVSYNITALDDGTQHLEMTVRVWPSSMKFEHDSIYLALTTGMKFEDHEDEGVRRWNKKEVPSKTDKRKSRKIALSFSDTEVGTDEYGFIPRIDGEDPDDEEDRYQAYLKKQGINATVAAGDIFLREDKMKIKLSELKQIIKEEYQATTRSVPKQKKVKQLTLSELRSIISTELDNPVTLDEGLWDKIKGMFGKESKTPGTPVEKLLAQFGIGWNVKDDGKPYWDPKGGGIDFYGDKLPNKLYSYLDQLNGYVKDKVFSTPEVVVLWLNGNKNAAALEKYNLWWRHYMQRPENKTGMEVGDIGDIEYYADEYDDYRPSENPERDPITKGSLTRRPSFVVELEDAIHQMGGWVDEPKQKTDDYNTPMTDEEEKWRWEKENPKGPSEWEEKAMDPRDGRPKEKTFQSKVWGE